MIPAVIGLAIKNRTCELLYRLHQHNCDLYFHPLIPDYILDAARHMFAPYNDEETPYFVYFSLRDRDYIPVGLLLSKCNLYYLNPYSLSTVLPGRLREIGCIPLDAIVNFNIKTGPARTTIYINHQEFMNIPFNLGGQNARHMERAVQLKTGPGVNTGDLYESHLHPDLIFQQGDLAEVTGQYLAQFIPAFTFKARPFDEENIGQIRRELNLSLENEMPVIYMQKGRGARNLLPFLLTDHALYVFPHQGARQLIPLKQIHSLDLVLDRQHVYLAVNQDRLGCIGTARSTFERRCFYILKGLFSVYSRCLFQRADSPEHPRAVKGSKVEVPLNSGAEGNH